MSKFKMNLNEFIQVEEVKHLYADILRAEPGIEEYTMKTDEEWKKLLLEILKRPA